MFDIHIFHMYTEYICLYIPDKYAGEILYLCVCVSLIQFYNILSDSVKNLEMHMDGP